MRNLGIKQPKSDIVFNFAQAKRAIKKIQFPIVIRPSYVLGGRAMRIIDNYEELEKYFYIIL